MNSRRKPQPWPPSTLPFADVIVSQNDIFVLSLVISYKELVKNDNPGMLEGLLVPMMDCIGIIYEAAVELGPIVESQGSKLPLWARQVNRIVDEYPALLLKMKTLGPILRERRAIDARRVVAEIFKISAEIQVELIKVALDKKRYFLTIHKIDQMSKEISNHRS